MPFTSINLTISPLEFELNEPEDKYNSDDEFYCDICEEKRYKIESVYYCEECKFIAEVRCVMSELLPPLTISEVQSTGRAISKDEENSTIDATIARIDNKIAGLMAEKKPLKVEIKYHRAMLQQLEAKLEPINTGTKTT